MLQVSVSDDDQQKSEQLFVSMKVCLHRVYYYTAIAMFYPVFLAALRSTYLPSVASIFEMFLIL